MSSTDPQRGTPTSNLTPASIGKVAGAASGGSIALLVAYHMTIIVPMFAEHSARLHPGVSAAISDVRTNEERILILKEGIKDTEERISLRLARIEDKLDRFMERRSERDK